MSLPARPVVVRDKRDAIRQSSGMVCVCPHLFLWSGSREPLELALAAGDLAGAGTLVPSGRSRLVPSGRSWLVPVLLSISASPSSLSVSDALFCTCDSRKHEGGFMGVGSCSGGCTSSFPLK